MLRDRLGSRPRKALGYRTLAEAFHAACLVPACR